MPDTATAIKPSDLIPRDEIRALHRRSNWQGLAHLFFTVLALVGTAWLIAITRGTWWVLPAMFLHGVQVVFLFAFHHECIHGTCFRSPWINRALNQVLGLIVFYPPKYFFHFHMTHHRHTQDPARDPEIGKPLPRSRLGYLWFLTGMPYWRRRFETTLRHAIAGKVTQPFIPEKERPAIVREARITWAIYIAAAAVTAFIDPWLLPLYWLGPAFLGQPALRLYQIMEHGGTAFGDRPLENVRSVASNPLMRWYHWNMPYHGEHHLFPNVPYHALPKVSAHVRARLRVVEAGYLTGNWRYWRAAGGNRLPETEADPPIGGRPAA